MTKEEYIKSKWEEAGFIWDEIKYIVSPVTGGLQLQHPSLKTSLTGYSEASDKELLKGYDFAGNGLKVWNKLLDGIESNNGWTKIESEADLPNKNGLTISYKIGKLENGIFEVFSYEVQTNWLSVHYKAKNVTHYKPVKKDLPPLY